MWWFPLVQLYIGVAEGSVDNSSRSVLSLQSKSDLFHQQDLQIPHTYTTTKQICGFFFFEVSNRDQLVVICKMGLIWMILIDNCDVLCL